MLKVYSLLKQFGFDTLLLVLVILSLIAFGFSLMLLRLKDVEDLDEDITSLPKL